MEQVADVGVIGGSGFYEFLTDARSYEVTTPYGPPSAPVVVGEVEGRSVAFLPRHGGGHGLPPHAIPYRANVWALAALGVKHVVAPCAVGSLVPSLGPGSLVVPDQFVDRTAGRAATVFDGPVTVHVSMADPYCPVGRSVALAAAREQGWDATDGGTMVVVEGPRFSTRAESQWFARQGWTLVNMTGHPEAVLARELRLGYTCLALVTDLDAGVDAADSVSHEEVFRVFNASLPRLRSLLLAVVAALPTTAAPAATSLAESTGAAEDLDARLAATTVRELT